MLRLQTLYVDMRPVLLKWMGVVGTLLFGFLLTISITGATNGTILELRELFDVSKPPGAGALNGGGPLGFFDWCVKSEACKGAILSSWDVPLIIKSFYFAGLGFCLLCALFGMYWRPEVVSLRDSRVNATRVEQSKSLSPLPPRRKL